ncbi:MAG: DoxX family protein [Saprospiraceae bacterium]|nr:DoxX family protein [Saprospiraceae bacterium]
MTLGTLVLNIAIVAILLTALIRLVFKREEALWMIFIQSFCGSLFIFSGWVKAVDPLGTAYKMEQYFAEFNYTFQDTMMSFIAPLFPFLSDYAVSFSVVMIVFEIVLGLALLIGAYRRTTAWAFFILTLFFTVLTGFTYLTGYVPSGANFFAFAEWTQYNENNMRVTDCGCFGDFIKLKPKVSFLKDVALLVPAILFIVFNDKLYRLFSPGVRLLSVSGLAVITLIYCFSNYVWDIPHIDFRPFKEGADIRAQYKAEQDAMAESYQIKAWKLRNKETGNIVEVSNKVYMAEVSDKYNRNEWEVVEQITGEPSIPITKISDFQFTDSRGNDKAQELLNYEGTTVMIVSYKLKGEYGDQEVTVKDTAFMMDTILTEQGDTVEVRDGISRIEDKQVTKGMWTWDEDFKDAYTEVVNPFVSLAQNRGAEVMALVGGAGLKKIRQFESDINATYPFYEADDILLKTIVRSNPGIVVWKDGKIIAKWHYKKLPEFSEVEEMF